MSGWEPGDLALSTHDWNEREVDGTAPDRGFVGSVDGVMVDDEGDLCLQFGEWPASAWVAVFFIKINPPKADGFDREIIKLMQGKPVREGV